MVLQLRCLNELFAVDAVGQHFALVLDVVLDHSRLLEVGIMLLTIWTNINDRELSIGSWHHGDGLTFF